MPGHADTAIAHAVGIIERACQLAGKLSFVSDLRQDFRDTGLLAAIERHDTPIVFDWLIGILSYQGIANSVATGFLLEHGNVRFSNRPFGVKRFQTIHHDSVDVAHGLVLLFGIGTKALPS